MKLKSLPTLKYPTVVVIGSFLQTALPFFEKCDNYGPNFTLHTLPRHFSEIFSKSILLPSVQILAQIIFLQFRIHLDHQLPVIMLKIIPIDFEY
ncbi:hypothetical protein T03_865 [Trichinella britovi]|uniref:Uncharacterized protein n=1 Tax=Trichinella britovi TaxID=45882 RepID=A0A0V1CF29_TRIBR|nr:hypothetical protein T03_865 [Trichinella britovi]